jgi:hypothetical protein
MRWRSTAVVASAIALSLGGGLSANAADGPTKGPPAADEPVSVQSSSSGIGALTLPPVSEEMSKLASELSGKLAVDPNFASVEVTRKRDRVIVYWHGAPGRELLDTIESRPSVPVEIRPTKLAPSMLNGKAASLARNDATVGSIELKPDGSGLLVALKDPGNGREKASASSRFSKSLGVPVEVASDPAPVPAANSRQFDVNYHLGGARIKDWGSGSSCTSGFAVRQNITNKEAMMFAAHCGPVDSQWSVYDGGPYYYTWGAVTNRDIYHDGAIIDSGWSQPYSWTAAWNSDVFTPISGSAYPYVGQEICYSGSYSGLKCGNIVQQVNVAYNLGGDLTNVTGFRTQQSNGEPAVGNGDSGGPGYQLVSTADGLKRNAVGIISAIPGGSGTTCQGVPGDSAPGGRKCSSTAYATSVSSIAASLGYYIPVW